MRWILVIAGMVTAMLGAPEAKAALKFGTGEHIRFVANMTLTGPEGERLYLARKLTMRSFALPYLIEDDGFVFGVSGESGRYYELPKPSQVEALQKAGHLPVPLPTWEMSVGDRLFGHSLWIFLAVLAIYVGFKHMRRSPMASPPNHPAPSAQTATAAPVGVVPVVRLPQVLRPRSAKLVGLLAVSVFFVAAGLWMSQDADNSLVGYGCAAFFGLCAVVFGIQLVPGSSYLRLTEAGFSFCSLFRKSSVRWADVEGFSIIRIAHNDMVGWNYSPHYRTHATGRSISNAIAGVEAALPDTYGMKATDLAALMNALRLRHVDVGRREARGPYSEVQQEEAPN